MPGFIENFLNHVHGATTHFSKCLVEALADMRLICEEGGPAPETTESAKL